MLKCILYLTGVLKMKKSIIALSTCTLLTCILFTTLPSPSMADQLDTPSSDISAKAETRMVWYFND